jgi:hypothetical protein
LRVIEAHRFIDVFISLEISKVEKHGGRLKLDFVAAS